MLRIYMFGGLNLFLEQVAFPFSSLPKVGPLLAYLLLHRKQPVTRDKLAFTIWSDVDEATARSNLRRHLYELNRALPPVSRAEPWILRDGNSVQWNPFATYWLDVAAFESLEQAGRLDDAIRLYKGSLLPLVDEEWLSHERDRLHSLFLACLQRRIDQHRQGRRFAEALLLAQQLLRYDPLHESAQRQLMIFRYALGDRAGAIQAYQQFVDLLERELGVPPMPETTQLRDQILANTVPPRFLDDEDTSTPVKAAPPVTHLPRPLRPLIGRRKELDALMRLIVEKERRLLTLTGPSGIGKSRLALAVAHHLADNHSTHFPDGFFFVSLVSLHSHEQLMAAIAAGLELRPSGRTPILETLLEGLRYKRLLMVLDNFEHLLPAAETLSLLMQAAPGLVVLVTSQALLQLYGEQAFPLSGLELPQINPLPPLPELAEFEAVAFYVEVAQATNPHFRLTTDNAGAVVSICNRLDGLPLAIELAAARSNLLGPQDILAQLEDILAFLATPLRDVPERHRSMQAALEWSFQMLSPVEQHLFTCLSVFGGGFDLQAVTEVTMPNGHLGQVRVLEILESLSNKNLVRAIPDSTPQRFDLLFTVRAFAAAKLKESGRTVEIRERHACYFAEQCRVSGYAAHTNIGGLISRMVGERDNLEAAASWLVDQPKLSEQQAVDATRLIIMLQHIAENFGQVAEALSWTPRLLRHQAQLPSEQLLSIQLRAAALRRSLGDFAVAEAIYRECLTLAEDIGDQVKRGQVLAEYGTALGMQGNYPEAERLLLEARKLEEDPAGGHMSHNRAATINNLAIVYRLMGRLEQAGAIYTELLRFYRTLGDELAIAGTLSSLGGLARVQQRYSDARAYYLEALEMSFRLNYARGIWMTVSGLVLVAVEEGDWEQAVILAGKYHQLTEKYGFTSTPASQREREQRLDHARQHLDPHRYRLAWARGVQMPLQELLSIFQSPPF